MIAVRNGKAFGVNRLPFSCGARPPPLDGTPHDRSTRISDMGLDAVAAILVFLVAMLAINRYEFGRFD
jgi:hypothetical protein